MPAVDRAGHWLGPLRGDGESHYRWPAWLTDIRCVRIICAGLVGASGPVPLAAVLIVADVACGAMGRP